jgi:hypothetical protein
VGLVYDPRGLIGVTTASLGVAGMLQKNSKVEYTYGWYLASAGINDNVRYNNKDKAVIRLKTEMHIYLTLKLLAPIY